MKAILTGDLTVAPSDADEILKFIAISGGNDAVLSALEGYRGRNEIFDQGLEELNTVVRYLADFGVPAENFRRGPDHRPGPWTTTPAPSTRPPCWITPRSAPSVPAAGTTIWRSITRTASFPARASLSA